MFAPLVPKIQQAVRDLGGESIDFAINTHFHFDHADGNPLLARSGTNIVALDAGALRFRTLLQQRMKTESQEKR